MCVLQCCEIQYKTSLAFWQRSMSFLNFVKPVAFSLLPFVCAVPASVITAKNMTWYDTLRKPKWSPPKQLFGPVWTILYSAMGVSSYLVYRDSFGQDQTTALTLYGSQLLLNWAWTPLFFGMHKLGLATMNLGLLVMNIGACVLFFGKINRLSSLLMSAYFVWSAFAFCLCFSIWKKNKRPIK